MHEPPKGQLELFDLSGQPSGRGRDAAPGQCSLHLRHDHLVLISIAGLIGLTVVFACGVERGKHLVRAERMLLARQPSSGSTPAPRGAGGSTPAEATAAEPAPAKRAGEIEKPSAPAPAMAPKPKPRRLAQASASRGSARYAIQLATYRQPHYATREIARLNALGERAFLMKRERHTVVYVGPFPSRQNAVETMARMKDRYRDCFLKTL